MGRSSEGAKTRGERAVARRTRKASSTGGSETRLTIGSLTGLEALYLAHNSIKLMPPQSVHMTALATLDLTGNPVEAMPSRMRRLDNMHALLHSKQKRQPLISRANNVRLSVKAAIMRDVMNPQGTAGR